MKPMGYQLKQRVLSFLVFTWRAEPSQKQFRSYIET